MSITYRSLLSLVIFFSFFSINYLPINPVYILSLFIILSYLYIIIYKQDFKISKYEFFTLGTIVILLITQVLAIRVTYNYKQEANILTLLLLIYSVLLGCISYNLASKVPISRRNIVYKNNLKYITIFLVIECLIRFSILKTNHPGFYAYKKSFFYLDSNFTGLIILSFLFFYYYLEVRRSFNFSLKYKTLLWLLLLLTISRAAIATALVLYFILLRAGRLRFIAISLVSLLGIYETINLVNFYLAGGNFLDIDGSLNSKFYIIDIFIDFYSQLSLYEKLVGIGIGNLDLYLNIFAHNIVVTFIAELGLLGTLILILYFIYVSKKSNHYSLFILLPIIIAGMSLFSAYSPFLFVLMALITVEENHKKEK